LKAKRYSALLLEINGYEIAKSIYEKSKANKNLFLMSLSEQILDFIEDEYQSQQITDFEESEEKSFSSTSENNQLIEAEYSRIMDSLHRYKHFSNYVLKTLHRILNHKLSYFEPSNNLVDFIIELMKIHSEVTNLQIYGIIFLHRLINHEFRDRIDNRRLEKVVEFTMNLMETHPKHQNLQAHSLSILDNDRILDDIAFDKLQCFQLVMDTLVSFENKEMNKTAIYMCAFISGYLWIEKKSNLFSKTVYLELLLNIIRKHVVSASDNDSVLKFTLMILSRVVEEGRSWDSSRYELKITTSEW
jgi:hypothetical protein